ncbi:SIS domain-containing protein [Leifsonia shinshuensis]|uniref:Glutamine--fructose-6-phosphate aminotransferase [isomerizing] n=1 Tax=Leifsonia shinshuensis TaxID=150026 RepID=A0A853CNW0_9MICO|nr:SIS domain-containing protein [Leifsonia shinshuensis]NYJ22546.1 glucosamine--fructose-6-phosphate aminotransferase (isomerizing) [Leifsonia shinshuensis]
MTTLTPFEEDILEQPAALRRLVTAGPAPELAALGGRRWDRIVFTGMGSSHFASIPTWRSAVSAGHDAWRVDAGELLDAPGLLTPGTLLVATSQSGASGEVVELLDRLDSGRLRTGAVVGIAADAASPLALQSDVYLPLLSGDEATVSTKSYLNTLAVHRRLAAVLAGEEPATVEGEIAAAADAVEAQLGREIDAGLAARVLEPARPRLAAVAKRDDAATALLAGLITKESSKVAIEAYVGGQFRHGPFELAGPGMTAFLYGAYEADADESTARLAADLVDSGAHVVVVGDLRVDGATIVRTPDGPSLARLATGAVVAELVAVDLARTNGVVPGAFAFGSKVTTTL